MKLCNMCAECGELEEDHGHQFVPVAVPDNCKCNPTHWRNPYEILAICDVFEDTGMVGLCENCDHTEECHKGE